MMKILHVCLSGPMTDGYGYQENILSKYHRLDGHEVTIIASQWVWNSQGKIEKETKSEYYNNDGVFVIRLPALFGTIENKMRLFPSLQTTISKCNPEIIFVHDCDFLDLHTIRKYVKNHPNVRLYIDNHNDYSNSAQNWISKNLLHKGLWKLGVQRIRPYTRRFYGVLPARVTFLKEMYGLTDNECSLLVMGADDELIMQAKESNYRKELKSRYEIEDNDFVITTGGKINHYRPETLNLMKAVNELSIENLKLIIFGTVADDLVDEFNRLCNKSVVYLGWLSTPVTYNVIESADLVVFPGLHSVMWEQAVAQGKVCIFKDIDGFHHLDVGGNALFIRDTSVNGIKDYLLDLYSNIDKYQSMKAIAEEKGAETFSYRKIAREAINT